MPIRPKTTKENWEVETNVHPNILQHIEDTRGHTAKVKIIPRKPQEILTHIQDIHKNTGDTPQLIPVETKQHMATLQQRGQAGTTVHQRRQPRKHRLSQPTVKKEVIERFHNRATKTICGNVITKGSNPLGSIQHTVCNLPVQINYGPVRVKPK